jgi:dihydroxyacetone kinase-like predicted kinase
MEVAADGRSRTMGHMASSSLGPGDYLEALSIASRVLDSHAAALDRLHRDPPADGALRRGVGTDLATTLEAAVQAARACSDFASICAAMVAGGREGCATRAGRDLVTVLDGVAEVLRNADRLDAGRLALALEAAAERFAPGDAGDDPGGFAAVLTVVADSALSAADAGAELDEVILQAADGGLEELERGPEANQRLAARGVVDAAAAGLLLVLDTLASVVTGEPVPSPPEEPAEHAPTEPVAGVQRYQVSCRLEPHHDHIEGLVSLEDEIVGLGDLLQLAAGPGGWSVTVATVVPGAVVEVLLDHGRPREVDIRLLGPVSGVPAPSAAPDPTSVAVGAG